MTLRNLSRSRCERLRANTTLRWTIKLLLGLLIFASNVTHSFGQKAPEPMPVRVADSKWVLGPLLGGLEALLLAHMPNGENLQIGLGCVTNEPKLALLIVAYFDDQLTDQAESIAKNNKFGTLEAFPGKQKASLKLLGINPHYDQILKHKSIIFTYEIDRDWLPDLWNGQSMRLDFGALRQFSNELPIIEFPIDNSADVIEKALDNCTPNTEPEKDYDDYPMKFEQHGADGNCDDCDWIFARGTITANTAKDFEAFISGGIFFSKQFKVRLQSPGGSLVGALALGRVFRKYRVSTYIGGKDFQKFEGISIGGLLPEPKYQSCVSACAYAFLGGVDRKVSDNGRYGIHQFYLKDAATQPTAPLLSGKDFGEAQRLQALLFDYVKEMDVDPGLVTLASSVPPWTPMRYLSAEEITKYHVNSAQQPTGYGQWSLEPDDHGGLVAGITLTQHGEAFKLIVFCDQQMGTALLLEDYNPYLKEHISDIKKSMQGGVITVNPKNYIVSFEKIKISVLPSPDDPAVLFAFKTDSDQLSKIWDGSSITLKIPMKPFTTEIVDGVEVPIGDSEKMVKLIEKNCGLR